MPTAAKNVCMPKGLGDAGYRSLYLSHAKRALYHLSYTPTTRLHKNSPLSGRNRTSDPVIADIYSHMLYQLSYAEGCWCLVDGVV